MRRDYSEPILRVMRFSTSLIIPIFLLVLTPLFSQTIEWDSDIDWESGTLILDATAVVDRAGPNAPAAAHRAEEEIRNAAPGELVRGLLELRLDSRNTLADRLRRDPTLYDDLASQADTLERQWTRPNRNLTAVNVRYTLPLFPTIPTILDEGNRPLPLRTILGWVPTRAYTGIVIYAAEPLRLHGTDLMTTIQPALRPEIFDENMESVLNEDQIEPEWVRRWGTAAYSESLDLSAWGDRIGENPKRILPRRLFGIAPTDIVISNADARELLGDPENRRLLREGRILVITPPTD